MGGLWEEESAFWLAAVVGYDLRVWWLAADAEKGGLEGKWILFAVGRDRDHAGAKVHLMIKGGRMLAFRC